MRPGDTGREEPTGARSPSAYPDHAAWEEIIRFVEARKALGPGDGEPYRWNRGDAYEERESRLTAHTAVYGCR